MTNESSAILADADCLSSYSYAYFTPRSRKIHLCCSIRLATRSRALMYCAYRFTDNKLRRRKANKKIAGVAHEIFRRMMRLAAPFMVDITPAADTRRE